MHSCVLYFLYFIVGLFRSLKYHLDPVAESLVNEFCELLDEIFARTEAFGEDEGVDAGTALPLAEIRSIGEVVVKLRSKNIIHNVPVEYHLRLLSLLDQHVQRANGREVDEDDDVSSIFLVLVVQIFVEGSRKNVSH